jgi:hypothetical protein
MKFYQVTGSSGVLSQNTWQNSDQFNSIAAGTGQANRLGRQIRVHRVRYAIQPSDLAANSLFAVSHNLRVDPTVAASDMFPGSGSSRAMHEYPNPLLTRETYHHRVATAMQWAGASFGTTPSYANVMVIVDQTFEKGKLVSYDSAGAVVGSSPFLYYGTDETSITVAFGVQIWFTDE